MTTEFKAAFTAEELLKSSLRHKLKHGQEQAALKGISWGIRRTYETVFGTVMSTSECDDAIANGHPGLLIKLSISAVSDGHAVFLTDDHCFGYGVLPREFSACSFSLPMSVPSEHGLEGNEIRTADQLLKVFHLFERQIQTIEELVDYLNQNY